MKELKDTPSYMKEGTVPRDFFDPTPEQQNLVLVKRRNSPGSRAADSSLRKLQPV
jgi:hypothetical protein